MSLLGCKRCGLSVILLLFIGIAVGASTGLAAPEGLFTSPEAALELNAPAKIGKFHPSVVRSRLVKVNFDLLKGDRFPDGAKSLLLNLFDDLSFQGVKDRLEKRSETRYTWFGRIPGSAISHVILAVENGVLAGNIMADGALYQVRAVGGGLYVIRKIDQSRFPEEAEPLRVPGVSGPSESLSPSPQSDDGSIIDVLVVYTAAAANASTDIAAEIQLAVDETNQAYANSDVAQRVRLVHAAQVDYSETKSSDTDLSRLRNGYIDNVHTLRETYGADLVSFWVEDLGNDCGIGYLMTGVSTSFASYGFSVIARECATGYYSFGHEMGHNMGAHHDRYVASEKGAYSYSHGYVNTSGRWRTMMAYNTACSDKGYSCTRIPYWSNPAVNYQGKPTGVSETALRSANNSLTLDNTAYTIANFRASVAPLSQMIGMLESPRNGAMVSGITTIHGWALSEKGIAKVELFIDGSPLGIIPYGGTRKDVQAVYPNFPNAEDSGFGMTFSYSLLSAGDHAIKVRIHGQDGRIQDLNATVTVKKFHDDFVENILPGTVWLYNNAVSADGETRNYDIRIEWRPETQRYEIMDIIER